jgi:putative addiction module CopG family antidote
MSMTVPADIEETIRRKVASGEYDNPSDVIRTAVRLLERRDRQLQELRALVAEGLASIERGEGRAWTPELMEEIERDVDEAIRLGLKPSPDVCP